MNARAKRSIGIIAAAAAGCIFAMRSAWAQTAVPALPGGATDLFSNEFVNSDGQNGGNNDPQAVTQGNLDNPFDSGRGNDVQVAIFAQNASTASSYSMPSGTFGVMDLLRIYAQGGDNGYTNGSFNGYINPPTEVTVYYGYTGGNENNFYTINSGNFTTKATILSVNGQTPTLNSDGSVSLLNAYTNTPTADNVGDQYEAYNVDLGVNIPAGANAVLFDFGVAANPFASSGGNDGGMWINAIQGANAGPFTSTWNVNGIGDFNSASSWGNSDIPVGVGSEAIFGNAITASHTVVTEEGITLTTMVFNNSNASYVIAGAGSITLQANGSGSALVNVLAGSHTFELLLILASNTTFNVASGSALTISGPLTIDAGETLTQTGSGTVNYDNMITVDSGGSITFDDAVKAGALTLSANAAVTLANTGATKVAQFNSISDNVTSTLNVTNNALVIQHGTLSTVFSQIQQGFAGGTWQGSGGITSSTAAGDSTYLTAVGVILNDTGANIGSSTGTPIYTSFDGAAVTDGEILVAYTYYGDANLSGSIDGSDYSLIDNGYNSHLTGWANGDFNYDGVVDGSDYTLIDNDYNMQGGSLVAASAGLIAGNTEQIAGGSGGAAVPEPTTLGLIGIGTVRLLGRRRTGAAPRGQSL
jgi:hypothetical protein